MIEFNEYGLCFIPQSIDLNDKELKAPTALVISSLFEEYRCSHRVVYELCKNLSENGVIVIFPDLTGLGNNEKPLEDADLNIWKNELKKANDFLRDRSSKHTVIPFRAGSLLISGLPADNYLLWHPIISGQKFLRQLRVRREIQNKITGDVVLFAEGDLEGQIANRKLRDELTDIPFKIPQNGNITLAQQSAGTTIFTEYTQMINENKHRNIRTRVIVTDSYWYPHPPTDYKRVITPLVEEVLR